MAPELHVILRLFFLLFLQYDRVKKGKDKQSTCTERALHGIQTTLKRSGMDRTVLTCNKHHACLYG